MTWEVPDRQLEGIFDGIEAPYVCWDGMVGTFKNNGIKGTWDVFDKLDGKGGTWNDLESNSTRIALAAAQISLQE